MGITFSNAGIKLMYVTIDGIDESEAAAKGIGSIFLLHATTLADYGKLIFWSFVAGLSERFSHALLAVSKHLPVRAKQRVITINSGES